MAMPIYPKRTCPHCSSQAPLAYDAVMDEYICPNGHRTSSLFFTAYSAYQQSYQKWQQQQFAQRWGSAPADPPKKREIVYHCNRCGDIFTDIKNDFCQCQGIVLPLELDEMTAQQANVRIWWDTSVSAYRMSSPFNRELVDAIKAFIPVSDRSYDSQSKIWTFVERQLTPLQQLLTKLRMNVVIVTRQQAEQASQSSPTAQRGRPLEAIAVEFLRLCGADAMTKAYRHAAMLNHPDRGGSMDKMSALNAAWDRLQKELYGQQ